MLLFGKGKISIPFWTFPVFLAAFLCLPIPAFSQKESPDKDTEGKILIVASYNPDTQRMSSFITAFERQIAQENVPYSIVIEDMGCREVAEASLWRDKLEDILRRYDKQTLKSVILLGQEAWATFLSLDSFPRNIPFFGSFASENGVYIPNGDTALGRQWNPKSINTKTRALEMGMGGGRLNRYDLPKNVDLILSIFPAIENIVFVSDNTYGGISLQAYVKQEMKKYPNLRLTLIDGRDDPAHIDQLIDSLPANSAFLLGTWRVGDEGQYMLNKSLDELIQKKPNLPVFSLSGTGMGSVAIGGYQPTYDNTAERIARQIGGYYRSGIRNSVGFASSKGQYRFDRNKLKDFGIPEYKLPENSVIEDSTESRLKAYKNIVLYGSIAFFVLLIFLAALAYFLRRNNRLKSALEIRERELIDAKEHAEESDLLKSAFLANMSHEIRTPLNAIVGFSSLLVEESITPEERTEYCAIISKNTDLMLTLINDILDISKLESGKTQFNFSDEDLSSICRQVIQTTEHIRKENVECRFEPSDEDFTLHTDAQRLSQVLINLLTNAGKFTESGSITLAYQIRPSEKDVLFSVTDTGCGIPRELQDRVFNRFEKVNDFKQGTGLGLAICKQIVAKFQGTIWIDPDYTGGTRFMFTHSFDPENREKTL